MVCDFILDGVKLWLMGKKLLPEDVLAYFKKQGRKGGKIGGKIRAGNLTPERRQEIAKKAAETRWSK